MIATIRAIFCCCLACCTLLFAADRQFPLISPMTTLIPAEGLLPANAQVVEAEITIPGDAPADLGAGCYIQDDTGRWFHLALTQQLAAGRQILRFRIDGSAPLRNEPGGSTWLPHQRSRSSLYGIFLWSGNASSAPITVHRITPVSQTSLLQQAGAQALLDLQADGLVDGPFTARTGERWELHCRPQPAPDNAYNPGQFTLSLTATRPDGSSIVVNGFYQQPLTLIDRGDVETSVATATGRMTLRLRPDQPGAWQLRLQARWPGGTVEQDLPPLQVSGEAWNDYIRVDTTDPRFFARGAKNEFFWPVGINLRSVTDLRSQDCELATAPTPNRGIFSYEAYCQRLGRAGCQLIEVWMSDWNLGLEGMPSTAGFHGIGNYHEANAARLDRLLDVAQENGLRVLLVINHHGQASSRIDSEWDLNPYNHRNGGPLHAASDVFSNPMAEDGQERLRRYIVARYADHPAILGWKLWTEIDLTDAGWQTRDRGRPNPELIAWHRQASSRWQELDPYDHPVTTHWSTNYTYVESGIAELDTLDLVCIDAYHGFGRRDFPLAELLLQSTQNSARGLERYGKPVLVTEYGGHPRAGPPGQILAEHSYAPWVALVAGHGAAPMLWWYEWVDQNDHYWPYGAINRFLADEDLRHPQARSVPLGLTGGRAWARAWARPGMILGYLLDYTWSHHKPERQGDGWSAMPQPTIDGLRVRISSNARAGTVQLEWWDPTTGTLLHSQQWQHNGGELAFPVPSFRRHLAFKLRRLD